MKRALGLFSGLLGCLAVGAGAEPATPDSKPQDPIGALMGQVRQPAPALPLVIGARIGEQPDRTRFVVELSDPVVVRVFTLANPDRIVIDMPSVIWRLQDAPHPSGKGAVRSYRYGLFRPGNSRFVIDLNAPVSTANPMMLPPEG